MLNNERIPNLVSKFRSDNIWPTFWPKNRQKLAKSDTLPVFDSFFGQKEGQMLFDLNFEARVGIVS